MANVYVNTLAVPRKARNKRIYAGNSFTSINRTEIVPSTTPPADEYKYPYGGIVTWRTGLTFDISRAGRPINGFFYESSATEVTLSAAHATLDRIDVVYIDINSVVGVITGTPSATPQKPSIDPATQYELSFVEIPAAATEPAGVDEDVIYNENVEWTGSQSGTTVDFDSTTDPKVGSKCAEITNISHGDTITFTNATTLNVADYTSVGFWIKLKSTDFDGNFIEAYFKKTGDPTGKLQVAQIDRQSLNWQFISFNTADFEIPNGIFDGFTLRWHNNGDTYTGFYLDYIKLQKGIELPVFNFEQVQSDWDATDTTRPEYIKNKPTIPSAQIQSDWNQTNNTLADYIKNKPSIPTINSNYLKDWIEWEFADFTAGTAKDYVLDLKALVGYTIDSAVMQVDAGTLTVSIKIGTTAVTSLSAVAVDTDIDQTNATGANTVSAGDKVILSISTTYTGSPTLIRGKLNLTRT